MKLNPPKKTLATLIVVGVSILSFVCYKAATTSFTHDESFSYLHYAQDSFLDLLSYKHSYTNNHILNSISLKYFGNILGTSELALRLSNILAFALYMIFAFLLFRKKNNVLILSIFILLTTNVALTNLFGLARGYGLSCGFMVAGLYFFIQYVKHTGTRELWLFHLTALLAVLSNFTLLTYYAGIMGVYFILKLLEAPKNKKFTSFKHAAKSQLLPGIAVVIILYEPVRRLLKNDLGFGGKSGFFDDTIAHLAMTVIPTYHSSNSLTFWSVLIAAIVIIATAIIIKQLLQKNAAFYKENTALVITNFLLLFISVIIVSQHYIFGNDYPIGRFALYLFPLYIIHFGFFIHYLINVGMKKVLLTILGCITILLSYTSINGYKLKENAEWGYDMNTKYAIATIDSLYSKSQNAASEIKLGVNWLFEPTVNFYRVTKNHYYLQQVTREDLSAEDDYWYIFQRDTSSLPTTNYEIIKQYPGSETILIRNLASKN